MLLEALKPERPDAKPPGDAQAGGGGGAKGQGQPCDPGAKQRLAELKLLKLLQQELNRRTRELHEAVEAAGGPTEEHRRQYTAISREQGQLADLVLRLLETEPQDPEDDPDSLPDVLREGPPPDEPELLPLEGELP